ncbi:ATP-binding protein [Bradyrhizobium sp. ORS 86]|uniref:ATP-binding protein n=1 Tax=Bradyrhizobium sp. ORS 86 TaxID=1685970 RepID=UPI003890D2AB
MSSRDEPSQAQERIDLVRARAAIIGAFDPFDLLDRDLDEKAEESVLNALANDIDEVIVGTKTLWRLSAHARHRELPRAIARGDFRQLLKNAKPLPGDRFAQHLIRLLKDQPSASYEKIDPPELLEIAVAQDFVNHATGKQSPAGSDDPRWVLGRIDEKKRLDHVAPKLVGRRAELAALRKYALEGEIVKPLTKLKEPVTDPGKLPWLRPVLVTGIGGSGKSALIAETVKSLRKDDWSGPITVLLDFDEPNLSLGLEREWTAELTRQIGRARAELDAQMDTLRREMAREARGPDGEIKAVGNAMLGLTKIISERRKPYHLVIVVDTFEEVLVQCDMRRPEGVTVGEHDEMLELTPFGLLLSWIDSIKSLAGSNGQPPFASVRAIVAGRAAPFPDEKDRLAAWFGANIEIGGFSPSEAAEFLQNRRDDARILSNRRIRKITEIDEVEWFPLLLLILILYVRGRSGEEIDDLIADFGGPEFYGSKSAISVLYSRFIDRIRDHKIAVDGVGEREVKANEIRSLAHPGLALRSVTPALIREVLAEPCGLGRISQEQAKDFFLALAREVWLVEYVGPEEVAHVKNLRRIMLPMLRGDETREGEGDGRPLREIVAEVHARAADWFSRQDPNNPKNRQNEAYYRAFLGQTEMLENDDALRLAVGRLAGEDAHAMPIVAASLLVQGNLTEDQAAALPEPERRKVRSDVRARKAKSGVVHASRVRVAREQYDDEEQIASSTPSTRKSLWSVLQDRDLESRVGDLFNQADFFGIQRLARSKLLNIEGIDELDPSPPGWLTGHWIWKWALANLGVDRSDDVIASWMLDELRELRRFGGLILAAVATVATGGQTWASRGRVRRLDVVRERLEPDVMRLMALGLTIVPKTVDIPAAYSQILRKDSGERDGRPPVPVNPAIARELASLRRSKQVNYLQFEKVVSRREAARVVLSGDDREMRWLVRGRTNELYAPARAALIDAARYEPDNFQSALEYMQSRATIWPVELEPARLIIELQKARQADFLLQRLIEVLDVSGLLGKMLEALDSSSALERVHNVARLFELYDELLLNGVVGAVPGGRRKQK